MQEDAEKQQDAIAAKKIQDSGVTASMNSSALAKLNTTLPIRT
jgi:hypothetical protein